MSKKLLISDNGINLEIADSKAVNHLSKLKSDDFLFNFHEKEARAELLHLKLIENELHINF
jgi:hypothetical protein